MYAVGHEALDWRGRCMAAVLAARPAVVSHLSAAYLWGLLRYRPEAISVTAPTSRRQRPGFRVHCARLHAADLTTVDGIPVTSFARTQLDLAAILSKERLQGAIERAEELRTFDLRQLEGVLDHYGGHPGAGSLRGALLLYQDDPAFTRSRLEQRFASLIRKADLPRPSMNFNVAGFEVDAYWEAERFAVELDVYETHGTRAAFERDRRRQEELKLAGVEMIRITGPRLDRESRQVVERVAVLLARRRRELGAS